MTDHCGECSRALYDGDLFTRTALGPLCVECGVNTGVVEDHRDDAALAHYSGVLDEALADVGPSTGSDPPRACGSSSAGFDLERDALGDSRR